MVWPGDPALQVSQTSLPVMEALFTPWHIPSTSLQCHVDMSSLYTISVIPSLSPRILSLTSAIFNHNVSDTLPSVFCFHSFSGISAVQRSIQEFLERHPLPSQESHPSASSVTVFCECPPLKDKMCSQDPKKKQTSKIFGVQPRWKHWHGSQ